MFVLAQLMISILLATSMLLHIVSPWPFHLLHYHYPLCHQDYHVFTLSPDDLCLQLAHLTPIQASLGLTIDPTPHFTLSFSTSTTPPTSTPFPPNHTNYAILTVLSSPLYLNFHPTRGISLSDHSLLLFNSLSTPPSVSPILVISLQTTSCFATYYTPCFAAAFSLFHATAVYFAPFPPKSMNMPTLTSWHFRPISYFLTGKPNQT
jgi:hypothetical protein